MQSIFKLVLVLLALISTIEGCILAGPGCAACYAGCTTLIEAPPAYAACIAACALASPGPSVEEQFIENLDTETLRALVEKHKKFEKKAQTKLARGEL